MKSFVWELKWWQGFLQLSFNLEIKAQLFSVARVHSLTFAFASLFSSLTITLFFKFFHSGQTICLFPCKVAVSCLRKNAPFSSSTLSSLNLNHSLDFSKESSLTFPLDWARHPSSAPQQNTAYLSIHSLNHSIHYNCLCLSVLLVQKFHEDRDHVYFILMSITQWLNKQMIVE